MKWQACNFIKKETLAQVFPSEFYEISKNTFFHRTPLVAASENRRKKGKVKWKNAVPSQNPHNIADNIRLINY